MSVQYYGHRTPVDKNLFWEQFVDHAPAVIAIDTETISLKDKIPIGFAIATSPGEAWWFDCLPENSDEVALLQPLMSNPAICKVYANCIFDLKVQQLIFQDYQFDDTNIVDILTWARVLGRTKANVRVLAEEIGLATQDAGEMLAARKAKTMLELPREEVAAKCANDAMVTLALYHYLKPLVDKIEGLSPDYFDVERKVVPVLIDMSQRGIAIDQEARLAMQVRMEEERDFYKTLCAEYDFNPGSGMQAGYILAKRGNWLPLTKSKKQYVTDEFTLEMLAAKEPLASAILGYKKATSALSKYLNPMKKMSRLYCDYGLDTEVGRTKSSNFNMQNIPSKDSRTGVDIRGLCVPDSGLFSTGDYSQEHLRILMHFSGDREMERVYYDGKDGGDIHISTANKIHRPRKIAKIVNYAIPYGGDPSVIAKQLFTRNIRWCSEVIDDWFRAYPDAAEWIHAARKYALTYHRALPTLFGRQISIPVEWKYDGSINEDAMGRKGVNYPILGSDGEVMKRALIICAARNLPLAVTVHDSITCDGNVEFPVQELETLAPVHLPFEVKRSERWE